MKYKGQCNFGENYSEMALTFNKNIISKVSEQEEMIEEDHDVIWKVWVLLMTADYLHEGYSP